MMNLQSSPARLIVVLCSAVFCGFFLALNSSLIAVTNSEPTEVPVVLHPATDTNPSYYNYSNSFKEKIMQETLEQLLEKYQENDTFTKVYNYMELKYQELKKTGKPREPVEIIRTLTQKLQKVSSAVKPFVKNEFNQEFDPDRLEKKVEKYLWLRKMTFLILNINEEHQLMVSFFFLPENETLLREFTYDIVRYGYPEVPDTPENTVWFKNMARVFERLAAKYFDIKEVINNSTVPADNPVSP